MALSTNVRLIDEATPALKALRPAQLKARRKALPKAAAIVTKFWKLELSGPATARKLGVRTGHLRQSIRPKRLGKDSWRVGTNQRYAAIHEYGGRTAPHVIRPRVGKVLRWFGAGGEAVFAQFVNHPGSNIPKRPHRAPAVKRARGPIRLLFRGETEKGLDEAKRLGRQRGRSSKRLGTSLGASARR